MNKIFFIGVGGFIGSVTRYLFSGYVQDITKGVFPYGTLFVNLLGCFLIGGVSELFEARTFLPSEMRAFVVVGILGGFTTFSAFGNETENLLRSSNWAAGFTNMGAHIVLAIGAVWLGRSMAKLLLR